MFETCGCCGWSYLTITEVNELGLLPAGPDEFTLKQLAVKVHPRTAVLPGYRLSTRVVGKQSHVHSAHEQSGQLDSSGVQVVNLQETNIKMWTCSNERKRQYAALTAPPSIRINEVRSKARSKRKQPIHLRLLEYGSRQPNPANTKNQQTQPTCSDTGKSRQADRATHRQTTRTEAHKLVWMVYVNKRSTEDRAPASLQLSSW